MPQASFPPFHKIFLSLCTSLRPSAVFFLMQKDFFFSVRCANAINRQTIAPRLFFDPFSLIFLFRSPALFVSPSSRQFSTFHHFFYFCRVSSRHIVWVLSAYGFASLCPSKKKTKKKHLNTINTGKTNSGWQTHTSRNRKTFSKSSIANEKVAFREHFHSRSG